MQSFLTYFLYTLMLLGAIGIVYYSYGFTFDTMKDSIFFYALGLLTGLFYLILKKYRKYIIYPILLFFGLSLYDSFDISIKNYHWKSAIKTIDKLDKAKSEAEIESIFQNDLKENKLKHFVFGFGSPDEKEVKHLKSKYKIRTHTMGCWLRDEPLYYNYLLGQYLISKHNDSILAIYRRVSISKPDPHP